MVNEKSLIHSELKMIKTKKELFEKFGEAFGRFVLSFRKNGYRSIPMDIVFTTKKPKFAIDDGGGLFAYAFNLETKEVLAEKYCGSGLSSINHWKEQFGEGSIKEGNIAIAFVERHQSSGNCPWMVTILRPEGVKESFQLQTEDGPNH